MTLTELNERIKEEVVLHDGDLKEWQWRRNGLLTEAEQDGIASPEFMRLVNDVSYRLGGLFPRINALKATAENYARTDRKQLTPAHTTEIITEAERLTLSRSFVVDRWLPAILATVPDPPKPEEPAPTPVSAPAPYEPATIVQTSQPQPASPDRPEIRLQIAGVLDSHKSQPIIPASVMRGLFHLIKADEAVLTEEIFSYLVSNFYRSAGELQGNTLRERLVSSDWQSLLPKEPGPVSQQPVAMTEPAYTAPDPTLPPSPAPVVKSFTATPARVFKGQNVTLSWEVENLLAVTIDDLGEGLSPINRGWIKPAKTADYTLFDANNNALSTVRVEVVSRDRSGIYGVLFALALLGLIYWFIKHTGSPDKPDREPSRNVERTGSRMDSPPARLAESKPTEDVAITPEPVTAVPEPTPSPSESPAVMPESAATSVAAGSAKEEVPSPTLTRAFDEGKPDVRPPSKTAKPEYEESTGDKPYDKVDKRTDEQGWRMAKKGTKWGYINQNDEWVIDPQFEAITPFKADKASVFLNGQLMNINRAGEQIR